MNIVKNQQVFGLNLVYNKLKGLNFGKPIQLRTVYGKKLMVNHFCGFSLGLSFAYFGFRLFRPPRLIDKHIIGVYKKIPNESFLFFSNLTPKLSILPRMLLKLSLHISNFRVILVNYRQRFVFKRKKVRVLFRSNKTLFYLRKLKFKLRGDFRKITKFVYKYKNTKFLLLSRIIFNFITVYSRYKPIPISNKFLWFKHKLNYNIFLNWKVASIKSFFYPGIFKLILKYDLYGGFFNLFSTRSVFSAFYNIFNSFGVFSKNLKKISIGLNFDYLVIKFLNLRFKDNLLTRIFGVFSFSGYGFLSKSISIKKRYANRPAKIYFKQRIILFKMFKEFWSLRKVYKVKNAIGKLNKIRYFRVNNFVKRFILRLDLVMANFFCISSLMSFVLMKFGFFKINGLKAKKPFQFLRKFDVLTVQNKVIGWLDVLKKIRKKKKFLSKLNGPNRVKKFKKISFKKKFRLFKIFKIKASKYFKRLKSLKSKKNLTLLNKKKITLQYKHLYDTVYTKVSKKVVSKSVFNKFYKYVNFFKTKMRKKLKRKLVLRKKKKLYKLTRHLTKVGIRYKKKASWLRRKRLFYERFRLKLLQSAKKVKAIGDIHLYKNNFLKKKKKLIRLKKLPLVFLARRRGIIFWSFKTFYMLRFFKFLSGGLKFHNVHRLLSRRLS